tara:strand:+ start:395 stop:601 length:207 start_codon:yes stop_codon:yes gene_type:complete
MEEKERVRLANEFIVGYAQDFITDEECNEMIDLTLNKISIVNGEGIIWDNTLIGGDDNQFDNENNTNI